jgi:hypothetical protein
MTGNKMIAATVCETKVATLMAKNKIQTMAGHIIFMGKTFGKVNFE